MPAPCQYINKSWLFSRDLSHYGKVSHGVRFSRIEWRDFGYFLTDNRASEPTKLLAYILAQAQVPFATEVKKKIMPPKVVKNGLIAHKMAPNSATKKAAEMNGDQNGISEVHNLEDLKSLVEKQNDTIKSQKVEIELLRKQMEKNVHLTQDFQSELSEIRKNWQSLSEKSSTTPATTSNNTNTSAGEKKTIEDVLLRLEALSSAYTDIQDRLYELDKSWKNNLMIYGVPCCDGEEDDPIITEEKVSIL